MLLEALEIVGSDVRNFECPRCGSHDRERHVLLYLRASGLIGALRTMRVLHFAPEKGLSRHLMNAQPLEYVRCDLFPASADVRRVDMQNMPFADAYFDLVVANHVLEHVYDDARALRELHRVLKPGGRLVLQTPYCRSLRGTWQDAGIDQAHMRLQAYGQEDHVRLFGSDIFERVAAAGFVPRIHIHADLLPEADPLRMGVNPDEPFMLFERGVAVVAGKDA